MGGILGMALSLMLAVGGAAVAAEGGPGAAQHYVAGHVLLGVGIGLLIATLLRAGFRLLRARTTSRTARIPVHPPAAGPARVTMLPVRTAPAVPLRGRHAA